MSDQPQTQPRVGILMGSESDLAVMQKTAEQLRAFGIAHEIEVTSAHRSPQRTAAYARGAAARGIQVIIVGAGMAAALGGAVAAETTLPVIGVPLASSPLSGFDALLATVMLPAGVPVATVAVGDAGAINAAVLAAQILALADSALAARLRDYKLGLEQKVIRAGESLKAKLGA